MKTSRLLFLIAGFAVFVISTGIAQPRIGAKAGLNLANVNFKDFGALEPDTKMLPTFMVGAVVEFDFSENVGLGTGLQYHGKGAQYDGIDDAKTTFSYLQVPIQLQYRSNGLFAAVGPYVAFAIGGKDKFGDEETDLEFGSSEEDDFSSLDFGVNLELGYEFSPSLRATAGYSLGLANGIPSDLQEGDLAITHAVIGVALTYLFGQQ